MFRKGVVAELFPLLAILALALGISIAVPVSVAQVSVSTGSLSGNVTDPQGASVPNARVTILNKATGTSQTMETGDTGSFTSGALAPGNYTVRIEVKNFKTYQTTVAVPCKSTPNRPPCRTC